MGILVQISMLFYAVGYDAAHLESISNKSYRLGLQHDIAYGSSFNRPRDNGDAKTVGRHLHKIMIIGATTYDMKALYGEGSQLT